MKKERQIEDNLSNEINCIFRLIRTAKPKVSGH